MTGDCHVRFSESRGVRFPPATHRVSSHLGSSESIPASLHPWIISRTRSGPGWSAPAGRSPPRCCHPPTPAPPSLAGRGPRHHRLAGSVTDDPLQAPTLLIGEPPHPHTLAHPPSIMSSTRQVVDPTGRTISARALAAPAEPLA